MAPIQSFAGKVARAAFAVAAPRSSSTKHNQHHNQDPPSVSVGDASSLCLEQMCRSFGASPADNLFLSTAGERGVFLRRPVEEGDVILSIPLSSCLRDDGPPAWYERSSAADDEDLTGERDVTDFERFHPSAWATRLAASLLDMELNLPPATKRGEGVDAPAAGDLASGSGREAWWWSLLPDRDALRASLPVHWDEGVLSRAKCTALDLAVDEAYFARAEAVARLSEELRGAVERKSGGGEDKEVPLETSTEKVADAVLDTERLQRMCNDALDIVQTRACRVERKCEDGVLWGPPLRVLAPIFDFINHGSGRTKGSPGAANASFGIKNKRIFDMHSASLVVRASRDIAAREEILIDYGEATRPAWRCLTSYGFVPEYDSLEEGSEREVGENAENVAELWVNGRRFEVEPHSVPVELVRVATVQAMLDSQDNDECEDKKGLKVDDNSGNMLTPAVARAIAKRAKEAAFNLITEPEAANAEEEWDDPGYVRSASLAALLRWSQHRTLLEFAKNLKLFSTSSASDEAEQ